MAMFPDCGKWLGFQSVVSGSVSRLWQVVRLPYCGKWLCFKTMASGNVSRLASG